MYSTGLVLASSLSHDQSCESGRWTDPRSCSGSSFWQSSPIRVHSCTFVFYLSISSVSIHLLLPPPLSLSLSFRLYSCLYFCPHFCIALDFLRDCQYANNARQKHCDDHGRPSSNRRSIQTNNWLEWVGQRRLMKRDTMLCRITIGGRP